MTDNQHRQITGYRDLSEEEIAQMNQVKLLANQVGALVDAMRNMGPALDQRWVSIASTNLQQGFMAAVRSIAKPDSF